MSATDAAARRVLSRQPGARGERAGHGHVRQLSAVDRSAGAVRHQAERRAVRRAHADAHGRRCRSRPATSSAATCAPRPTRRRTWSCIAPSTAAASCTRTRSTRRCSRRRGAPIRCMGTTHADYFRGDMPVTRPMTREEVERDYEKQHGPGDRRDLPANRPVAGRDRAGRARRQPRAVHVGPGPRRRRSSTRACSSTSRASSGARARSAPDAAAPRPVPGRQALPAQARPAARTTATEDLSARRACGTLTAPRRFRGISLALVARHDARRRRGAS